MGTETGQVVRVACRLYPPWQGQDQRIRPERIAPDGSSRLFFRLRDPDGHSLIAVLPAPEKTGRREALAAWQIGRHLRRRGAPLPMLLGYDNGSGLLLCEDLGRLRLHDLVLQQGENDPAVRALYEQAVRALARMQVQGAEKFSCSWCWDTPRYDREVMIRRESLYFLEALCVDLLGIEADRKRLLAEFRRLAREAEKAGAEFFLHRDFQSRNIMVRDDQVVFIDYQAGRLGPLAYDLASLLLDPYVRLSASMQVALKDRYFEELSSLVKYDRDRFEREFRILAVQRNLQALGAYGYLSGRRGRRFFRSFIGPALLSLQRLLAGPCFAGYPALRRLADEAEASFAEQQGISAGSGGPLQA